MSNKDSHAAALAAFNAINKSSYPKAAPAKTKAPIYYKNTHSRSATMSSLPHINTSAVHSSSYLPAIITPRAEVPGDTLSVTPTVSAAVHPTPYKPTTMSKSTSTSQIPDVRQSDTESIRSGTDYFTLAKSAVYNSPETRKGPSTRSNLSINRERTQETLNNLKSSLNAKAAPRTTQHRIYHHTDPKEMVNAVKQSINEKSKKPPQAVTQDSLAKTNDKIAEIRESIDSKRITTTAHASFLDQHSGYASGTSSSYKIYSKPGHTNSYSSFGSMSATAVSVKSGTPAIVTTEVTAEDLMAPPKSTHSSSHSSASNANLPGPSPTVSPINIPLSSGANARGAAVNSSENLDLLSSKFKYQSLENNESQKIKLRRKPPPGIDSDAIPRRSFEPTDNDQEMSSTQNGLSSKSSIGEDYESFVSVNTEGVVNTYSDSAIDEIDGPQLPQFPGIEKIKEHRHKLFKKKYKFKGLDAVELQNLEDSDLVDSYNQSSPPSRSATPAITYHNQPVQLKTTMRKKQRKKAIFNENKPWKNHKDLFYVTEQERKRYEGVWVSNKGLYIKKAVVKFAAVDYDQKPTEPKALEDISLRAAKISSQFQDMSDEAYFKKLHGLDSIEPDQLIHGVVVKRIWEKSRLPSNTLEAIWNLVDFRNDGTLNRPEFLVGMWLIDQTLYGRKLPKKVDQIVWHSLENIGLSVVIKKKGKR